jgi:hypothetical protein
MMLDWFFAGLWTGLTLAWLWLARSHYRSEQEFGLHYALRGWKGWKMALVIASLHLGVAVLYVFEAAA